MNISSIWLNMIDLWLTSIKSAGFTGFQSHGKLTCANGIKFLMAFVLLTGGSTLKAQDSFQVGFVPGMNFYGNLKNSYVLSFKVESHQKFLDGLNGRPAEFDYQYSQTNISLITTRKLGHKTTLGAGYLVKFVENDFYHRFLQQFFTFKKFRTLQVRQRFMTDQTFSREEKAEYRFRYRVTTEIPFKGHDIDTNELYFKMNNECLNSLQDRHYDLEFRIVPMVGYGFSDASKLEWGLDYRIGHLMSDHTLSSYWLSVNWQIGI